MLAALCLLLAAPADDAHSRARPDRARVSHVALDLTADFDRSRLSGHVTLTVTRPDAAAPLVLDVRGPVVSRVEASADGKTFAETRFALGDADKVLGSAMSITLPEKAAFVRVHYHTPADSGGLQWLSREMTASKKLPFLFTQSQAIQARTWIPLQDSPAVRVTYDATIRVPKGVTAVMSAEALKSDAEGTFRFAMKQPVPPYLIALAAGDIAFAKLGPRTGVYAEPGVVGKAAKEFADLEKMLSAVESLYGPYRWGRYDVLVLPPSFPFGGMENPRLTFLSPTVLAGDKSLVSVLAHELAHSWSGNLVTNATWRDFWLNEGFTVYLERRIVEKVYGEKRATLEAMLGRRSLLREMESLKLSDQVLHIDLTGRDADEGLTDVAYEKGALFLRHLEETFGREAFDSFLKGYFDRFAFKSITTAEFEDYLTKNLLDASPGKAAKVPVKEWLYKPGLPGTAPTFRAEAFEAVERQVKEWTEGKRPATGFTSSDWTTHEWLHFLETLPATLTSGQMATLDGSLRITRKENSEIRFAWLMLAVKHGYAPAYPALEAFLTGQGRRKFLSPLYAELMKTADGRKRARAIYAKARPTYHPIAVGTIDAIVTPKLPDIVGHRGASYDRPENTVAAFREAWAQKADAAELDVFMTKDGKLVVIHDANAKRTTGVDKIVAEMTLDEVRKLDAGKWKSAAFAGEKVPTLAEMLATCPAGKRVYVEVKCGPEAVPELLRVLKESKLPPERTPVISFNSAVVAAVKKAKPEIPSYWIVSLGKKRTEKTPTAASLIATAKRIKADGLDLSATELLDEDMAKAVKAAGLRLDVWTVNTEEVARRMMSLGVDGITTDRPGWLRGKLRE